MAQDHWLGRQIKIVSPGLDVHAADYGSLQHLDLPGMITQHLFQIDAVFLPEAKQKSALGGYAHAIARFTKIVTVW